MVPIPSPRAPARDAPTIFELVPSLYSRGEGGRVDVGRAFMVARCSSICSGRWFSSRAGDHKGPPSRSSPPSPLRNVMGYSGLDSKYRTTSSRWAAMALIVKSRWRKSSSMVLPIKGEMSKQISFLVCRESVSSTTTITRLALACMRT